MTETCQISLAEKSKSHKVCVTVRERREPKSHVVYATKRFDLKRSALDIKEEKMGQFSVCCGGKARLFSSPFFDKGRGAEGRRGEGKLCLF